MLGKQLDMPAALRESKNEFSDAAGLQKHKLTLAPVGSGSVKTRWVHGGVISPQGA